MSDYYDGNNAASGPDRGRLLNIAAAIAGLAGLVSFFLTWLSIANTVNINGFWLAVGGGILTSGLFSCICLVPLAGLALIVVSAIAIIQGGSRYIAYAQFAIAALLALPVIVVVLGMLGVFGIVGLLATLNINGARLDLQGNAGIVPGIGFWIALIVIVISLVAAITNLNEGQRDDGGNNF